MRRMPVTARDLARVVGVSLRTLYRDIADLQAMGAPIRGEGGVGYVMEPGYFMPSLQFDEDELSALALGLRLVAVRTDPSMSAAARRAAAKIASAVSEELRRAFLDNSLEAGTSDAVGPPRLETLRTSIRKRKILEIDYLSLSEKRSTRRARPLGLTVFDKVWLLTVWCETAQDFRHLRLDRIDDVREIGERYSDERGKRFADCLAREGNDALMDVQQ